MGTKMTDIAVWSQVGDGFEPIDLISAQKMTDEQLIQEFGTAIAKWIRGGAEEPYYRYGKLILQRAKDEEGSV